METVVYTRFDSYDFGGDKDFQKGLICLQTSSNNADKILDMKLFFYNRFVEPIDPLGYKRWHSGSAYSLPDTASKDDGVEHLERLDLLAITELPSDQSTNNIHGSSIDTGPPQLSFEEVIRLIKAGEEVPGLVKLDIKPTDQIPTASQMERRLKPWENK